MPELATKAAKRQITQGQRRNYMDYRNSSFSLVIYTLNSRLRQLYNPTPKLGYKLDDDVDAGYILTGFRDHGFW